MNWYKKAQEDTIADFYKKDPHYVELPNMYPSLIIKDVRIAFTTSIKSKTTYIEGIDSKNREKGLASEALDYFIALSKNNGFSVILKIYQEDLSGLSEEQLKSWYKRHGFNQIKNTEFWKI
jgi:hypothetical protein